MAISGTEQIGDTHLFQAYFCSANGNIPATHPREEIHQFQLGLIEW